MTPLRQSAFAIVLAALIPPDASAAQTCPAEVSPVSPPLNHTWRLSAHNAYFHGIESSGPPFPMPLPGALDLFSSGAKQHLLDDFYIDRIRALELDLHGVDGEARWEVFHTNNVGGSLCVRFEDCLRVVRAYHLANPRHDVIFIHLESKEALAAGGNDFFTEPKSPQVLDDTITGVLGDAVFGPADYIEWCRNPPHADGAASENQCYGDRPPDEGAPLVCETDADCPAGRDCDVNLQKAVTNCRWPTMRYLRGRIIFTLHGGGGGDGVTADNKPNVTRYENSGMLKRKIFSMNSPNGYGVFLDVLKLQGPNDPIPPSSDPGVMNYKRFQDELHGIIRGGWRGDAMFPGHIAGSILTLQDWPGLRGINIVNTDATRSMPMSYLQEDLRTAFAGRTCSAPDSLGLVAGLNWSSGCQFQPPPEGTAASEPADYVDRCDPCALREENSGIFVSVEAPRGAPLLENGFLRLFGDEIFYLAKPTATVSASVSAFVSTRTNGSIGNTHPSEGYGRFFSGRDDMPPPCSERPIGIIGLGPTYTGSLGCVMARADLTDDRAPFVAVCRHSDRNGWYSPPLVTPQPLVPVEGAYLVFRTRRSNLPGSLPQEFVPTFVPQLPPENGVGYAELQNFFRLEHTADRRCWTGYIQSTIDPPSDPRWKEQQIGRQICFDEPLQYVGFATDGGPVPVSGGSRGDYLFANTRYDGHDLRLVDLSEASISHSGELRKLLVDDRSYFPDTDGDGLLDRAEDANGNGRKDAGETDADDADSDDDSLSDGDELSLGLDPLDPDHDDDLLDDGDEIAVGTDPKDPDSDDDGLGDGDEVSLGTDPLARDSDSDGLSDGDEVNLYGTDPLDSDTDDDGLSDGDEVARGLNPLQADTDDDGLRDGFEVSEGLDPKNPDVDGDGILDGRDPDLVANFVNTLAVGTFRTGGNRNALLARLEAIERTIGGGRPGVALDHLRNLRGQMDGCGSAADATDWIIDCDAQNGARLRLDLIVANIQA